MTSHRVTMREIASAAGVSRTTVSFVLNNVPGIKIGPETRQRILEVARELNYIRDSAATSLARRRAGTLALVLRQTPHQVMNDRFLMEVLLGLSAAVREAGFHVLIEPLDPTDTTATYGNLIRGRHADGIVLSGPRVDDEEMLRISLENLPIVMIGQLPQTDIPSIDVDNVKGARMAVDHLIGLGHRRIACITNAPLEYTSASDRLRGYGEALEHAGIPYDEGLVRFGDFTDEGGMAAMTDLLELPKPPSAVFVASDAVALGALNAIHQAQRRVPEDIALVGFDDIPLAQYIDPPLTTVRLPAYGLGWGAGDLLMRVIAGTDEVRARQVRLETELIVRQSSGHAVTGPNHSGRASRAGRR